MKPINFSLNRAEFASMLAVAMLYAISSWLTRQYFSPVGEVSIFHLASGVALAAVLLGGPRYAMGVTLGSLLTNVLLGEVLWVVVLNACGATLAALVGSWLIQHNGRFDLRLRTLPDFARVSGLGGFVGSSVSAVIGGVGLWFSGAVDTAAYPGLVLRSLMGDALGVILMTPLLLLWWPAVTQARTRPQPRQIAEGLLILICTLLAGAVIFLDGGHNSVSMNLHLVIDEVGQGYWMFLFIAWSAIRLGQRGTALALLLVAALAATGILAGTGFFRNSVAVGHLSGYWSYSFILSLVGMVLASFIDAARRTNRTLGRSQADASQRLKNVLAALDQHAIVAITDVRGRILSANDKFCDISGYSRDELLGQDHAMLNSGIHSKGFFKDLYRTLATGETWQGEVCNRAKDGHLYWLRTTVSPFADEEGKLSTYVAIRSDITGRKHVEQELRFSEERLQLATRSGGIGIWDWDLQTNTLIWDDVMLNLYGLQRLGFSGAIDAWQVGMHPDDLEEQLVKMHAAIAGASRFDTDFRVVLPDGRIRHLKANADVIGAANGKSHRMVGVSWDITASQQKDAELASYRNHLEDLVTQKTLDLQASALAAHRALSELVNQKYVLDQHAIVTVCGLDGLITYGNQKFIEASGLNPEEFLGQDHKIGNSGYHPKGFFKEMYDTISRGQVWRAEVCNRAKDGHLYWVDSTVMALMDDVGKPREYIAVRTDISARKQNEQIETFHSEILELLAKGAALPAVLEATASGVERLLTAAVCSILLLDSERQLLRVGAAPSLPDFFNKTIEGLTIGLGMGSCGTAAFTGERVIVSDIQAHPYWAAFRQQAQRAGLRACWSQPIVSSTGQVLGTFAIYHRGVHTPAETDIALIQQAAQQVSIAIERNTSAEQLRASEAYYRLLTEDVVDVVWKQDRDQRFTYISPADERLRGYPAAEVVGHLLFKFLTPEGIASLMEQVQQKPDYDPLDPQANTTLLELQMRCKDGSWVWTEVVATTERDADGIITGFHGMSRSIEERKRSEAALKTSQQRFELAVESADEGVWDTDLVSGELYHSPRMWGMLGYTEAQLPTTREAWDAITHPDDLRHFRTQALAHFNDPDHEFRVIVRLRHHTGDWRWILSNGRASRDAQGRAVRFTGTHMDITERKQSEEAAYAANRSKSEFLANMSHEIRTPMNGVIGMVDILQQTPLLPEQARMLSTIHDSSMALLNILNDILDFSKIEAGKLDVESIPTHLREVTEGVAQLMLTVASNKGAQLSLFVDPALPVWMMSDPTRLRQILFNLLGNALKFVPQGAGQVLLHVNPVLRVDGVMCVQFSIIDNGIGMSEAVVAKLFQPFTQADATTARKFGGTGLGLSITQRLVEMMHGRIIVTSTLGLGSEFMVEFPLLEAAAPRGRNQINTPDLTGVRVLAVTPIALSSTLFQVYLGSAGAQVKVVPDLATARLQLAQQSGETVVLLDLTDEISPDDHPWPKGAHVVRLVNRADSLAGKPESGPLETRILARPLLHLDLIHGIAMAGGRVNAADPVQFVERRRTTRQMVPTVEEAAQSGQLILIAEDNETNRDVLREQLRLLGYAAEMANDGALALQMWRKGQIGKISRYALLLTDCHMPNMDGFELTKAIRESELSGAHLPIIAITANAMQGEAQRCRERGMDDYLSKPLRLNELGPMLHKWMPESVANLSADTPCMVDISSKDEIKAVKERNPEIHPFADFPIWNPDILSELVGDNPALHKRLLEKFLINADIQVAAIVAAAGAADAATAGGEAHTLKSAARSVGALALGELCQSLENAGHAGDAPACLHQAASLPIALAQVAHKIKLYLAP